MAPLTDSSTSLLEEIDALLAAPRLEDPGPLLARIEDTLSIGYARALALEAEHWRLERRLGELAACAAGGELEAKELTGLTSQMATADGARSQLRARLGKLRDRARQVRAA